MLALLPELWLQVEVVSSRWFSPCEKKIKKNKFLLNSKKTFFCRSVKLKSDQRKPCYEKSR